MAELSKKAFGQYIKKVRTEKGMSREEFANKLYASYSVVGKWENGLRYPDFEMITKIAEVLDISVQDIIDNSKKEEKSSANMIGMILAFVGLGTAVMIGIYLGVINSNKREVIPGDSTDYTISCESITDQNIEIKITEEEYIQTAKKYLKEKLEDKYESIINDKVEITVKDNMIRGVAYKYISFISYENEYTEGYVVELKADDMSLFMIDQLK